jgi:hypothetical protein
MKSTLAIIAAVVLIGPSASAADDLAECIAGARRFQQRYERIAANVEINRYRLKTWDDDKTIPDDRLFVIEKMQFWRDGRNARTMGVDTHRRRDGDRVSEREEGYESVASAEMRVSTSFDPKTRKFDAHNITAEFADGKIEPIHRDVGGVGFFVFGARIDPVGPRLADRLTVATATVRADQVGGQPVVRVEFEDDWGMNVVWFDPAHDYHPIRMTQRKLPRHWVRPEVRLESVPTDPRFGIVTERLRDMRVVKFQKAGSQWFAEKLEEHSTYQTNKPASAEDKIVTTISDISGDPRARVNEFKITTFVPDGTWVLVGDSRAREYEWRGGKVVKIPAK